MNQSDFNNILNSRFPLYTHFYTDAPVSKQPDSVGFGIHAPSLSLKISGKLPDHWSICTGEMYAIGRAIEEIIERRVKLLIIITNSLSAFNKLGNDCLDGDWDIVSINVKKSIYNAWCSGYKVVWLWIPTCIYTVTALQISLLTEVDI
ncbi:hypothetical protein HHI36_005043 [Cryptolaemus montrouzieri]|uniref:RNase H type-1 domain-containing protein n=1 Tax=Cryptolaemus montrouzieri TaxID=559131 RepID=A0ABD2NUJ6_9CUCU